MPLHRTQCDLEGQGGYLFTSPLQEFELVVDSCPATRTASHLAALLAQPLRAPGVDCVPAQVVSIQGAIDLIQPLQVTLQLLLRGKVFRRSPGSRHRGKQQRCTCSLGG